MSRKSTDHIVELSQIIAKSVADLQRTCEQNNFIFPGLDDTFTTESEAFRSNPEVDEAANIIAAAAFQLVAAVLPTPTAVYGLMVLGSYKSACLRVAVEANIVEILREAGTKGLHINDIAAKCNIPSQKLVRVLRCLATYHFFKELTPDVFTNTRLSSSLDTGKSVAKLFADPSSKHDKTNAFAALVCHHLDEAAKGSAYLWETLSDPLTSNSLANSKTAFNRALNTDLPIFEFFESEAQAPRLNRFGHAMGTSVLFKSGTILDSLDWKALPKDAVVVDVGGGVGSATLLVAEKHEHLQIVNQDRAPVIEDGHKLWASKLPKAIESGRAKLQVHDFFTEQPVKNASVFLMKQIVHDWSDADAIKILTHLRQAAQPNTKLVLVEHIIRYACPFPNTEVESRIAGAIPREAEAPLLANYGINNSVGYFSDITMMILCNSPERTIKHFSEILNKAGWKLTEVKRIHGAFLQALIATPV